MAAVMLLASPLPTQKAAWVPRRCLSVPSHLAGSRPPGKKLELGELNSPQERDNGALHLVSFWGVRNERRKRPPEADLGTPSLPFSVSANVLINLRTTVVKGSLSRNLDLPSVCAPQTSRFKNKSTGISFCSPHWPGTRCVDPGWPQHIENLPGSAS